MLCRLRYGDRILSRGGWAREDEDARPRSAEQPINRSTSKAVRECFTRSASRAVPAAGKSDAQPSTCVLDPGMSIVTRTCTAADVQLLCTSIQLVILKSVLGSTTGGDISASENRGPDFNGTRVTDLVRLSTITMDVGIR